MLNFIIDIFCKDTVVGLSDIGISNVKKAVSNIEKLPPNVSSDSIKSIKTINNINSKISQTSMSSITSLRLYKNVYSPLFNEKYSADKKFKDTFIDPIACHLSEASQNQKALYSV